MIFFFERLIYDSMFVLLLIDLFWLYQSEYCIGLGE